MHNRFSVIDVTPDLSKKQIVIETNFKVDANTVNPNTVSLYKYDISELAEYKLEVDGKKIIINLVELPVFSMRYYLKVDHIKDALGRSLSVYYSDAFRFSKDIITKVNIISPASRETLKDKTIDVVLKISNNQPDLIYNIEFSPNNAFFNKVSSIKLQVPIDYIFSENQYLFADQDIIITDEGLKIIISNGKIQDDELYFSMTLDYEGQIYARARAEFQDTKDLIAGDWCETISFNIYTIQMDSLNTTFLEDYLTTDNLFEEEEEETAINPTLILDKSTIGTDEKMFFIELNKEVLIKNLELNEDGYYVLGTVLGLGKDVKL